MRRRPREATRGTRTLGEGSLTGTQNRGLFIDPCIKCHFIWGSRGRILTGEGGGLTPLALDVSALSKPYRSHHLEIMCLFRTGCPKSLGHFLKPCISKTTMHDGKFETHLERKNSGFFFIPNSTPFATHLYIYIS